MQPRQACTTPSCWVTACRQRHGRPYRSSYSVWYFPRAHDCCTLFLGSRLKFKEHFSQTTRPQTFTSVGYMSGGKRSSQLLTWWGNPWAEPDFPGVRPFTGRKISGYIMETLQAAFSLETHGNRVVFILVPETDTGDWASRFRGKKQNMQAKNL